MGLGPFAAGARRGTRVLNFTPGGRLALLVILTLMAGALVLPFAGEVSAQTGRDARWQRYDVNLDLRADGSLHVVETQTVALRGRFRAGFAVIPLTYLERIGNIAVTVEDDGQTTTLSYRSPEEYAEEPGTFTIRQQGGTLEIDYSFEPTSGSETRLITLE